MPSYERRQPNCPQRGILISGPTYEALGSRRAEFTFTDLGEIQIRGKVAAVQVWAVEAKTAPGTGR